MHHFFIISPKIFILLCGILLSHFTIYTQDLKLSLPQVNLTKGIIKEKPIKIFFDFRMDGAEIRYTTDGTIPTTKSKKYTDTLHIKKACIVKAKSFHPDYLPSDVMLIDILESGKAYASVTINQPNEKYKADGSWTINNKVLGDLNFQTNYLGYEGEPIVLDVTFEKKEKIKDIVISTLINQGAWIFGPSMIVVMDQKGKVVQQYNTLETSKVQDNKFAFIHIPCKGKYKSLRIIIDPLDIIPNWHDGKGGKPWLFVDEVLVY